MTTRQHIIFFSLVLLCACGVLGYQWAIERAYPHGAPPGPRVPYLVQLAIAATVVYVVLLAILKFRSSRATND